MKILILIFVLFSCELFTGPDLMEETLKTKQRSKSLEVLAGVIVKNKSVLTVHWNTNAESIYMKINTDDVYEVTEWNPVDTINNTVEYQWKANEYWNKDVYITAPYNKQYERVKEMIRESVLKFAKENDQQELVEMVEE